MSKLKLLFMTVVMTVSLISCDKLDDMGDNAEAAKDNSGRAADAAQESREEIAHSRLMSRSGATSAARNENLKLLEEMSSFEMKATLASKYVMGFEFQLWTGQKYDSQEYLETLYEQALEEFFRSLVEINGGVKLSKSTQSPFRIRNSAKMRDLNVFAMAVSMHKVHNVQEHIVNEKKNKSETISVYSLVKNSLLNIKKVSDGSMNYFDLKPHERIVDKYYSEAVAIMQARLNMLLTMNLAIVSPIKDSKMTALLLKTPFRRSYRSSFNSQTRSMQMELNKYLDGARKTKVLLESIGVEPNYVGDLTKYYRKMILPEVKDTHNAEEKELIKDHKNLISEFF